MDDSETLARTLMGISEKYIEGYRVMMSAEPSLAVAYRPLRTELPLFEAANYLLARTDQLYDDLSIAEDEFIDLIVELRGMFRVVFRAVDPNNVISECVTARQNHYGSLCNRATGRIERNGRLHSYLSRLMLRAEVEEVLFLPGPEDDERIDSSRKIETSLAALQSLESRIVDDYLGLASALVGGGVN